MILYDCKGNKIRCVKTVKPRMKTKRDILWDSLIFKIDGQDYYFHFRYSGSFFFQYGEDWFKTGYDGTAGQDIGFDAFPRELYTKI